MTAIKRHKIILREVNRHLVCRLCRGYYVDATTIAECLHSFCRSCIIKYLETNSFCPICEVQIHKTKPYLNLRLDKALQDVVYKLVPGLYHDEMARRRKFYQNKPDIVAQTTPEQRGVEERLIFSPEDIISLSLEFIDWPDPEPDPVSTQSSENGEDFPRQLGLMKVRRGDSSARKESTDSNEPGNYPKQFLNCPAGLSIRLLKKFLTQKFEFSSQMEFEILYKRVPLPEHYTLMDVAYIFTWKRMAPMRLYYQITQKIPHKKPERTEVVPKPTVAESIAPIPEPVAIKVEPQEPAEDICKQEEVKKPECVIESLKKPTESLAKKTVEVVPKKEIENSPKKLNEVSPKKQTELHKKPSDSLHKKPSESLHKKPSETLPKKPNDVHKKLSDILPKKLGENFSKKQTENSPKKSSEILHKRLSEILPKKLSENVPKKPSDVKKPEIPKKQNEMPKKSTESLPKKPSESLPKKLNETLPKKPTETLTLKPTEILLKKPNENSLKRPRDAPSKPTDTKTPPVKEIAPKSEKKPETEHSKTEPKNLPPEQPKPKMIRLAPKEPEPSIPHPKMPSPVLKHTPEPKELEKLLLNPVSGRLEAEPKKEVKSSVQQLKTFRKEKNSAKANALTITTAPSKDKPSPKEEANVSIEIKTEGTSEYDFESSSPPNRIMSLQEYTQSEIYKTKYSKMNGTMNLQDFRQQVLNGKPEEVKKDRNKDVPLLYRIQDKKKKEEPARVINIKTPEMKLTSPPKTMLSPKMSEARRDSEADAEILRLLLKRRDSVQKAREEKRAKTVSPKVPKPPAVNPEQKPEVKKDQAMLEMLISVAQKQSFEPMLKVPQFPHGSKPANQVSQSDINQALQFFQKLSSEMTMLEAKQQPEQSVPPKPPSMLTFQQYYLQQIEFVRMLKRQQAMTNEVTAKLPKADKQPKTEEAALKSMDRTLSQIQEQVEIQRRLVVAQNCKNIPPLLQYFNNALFPKPSGQNGQKSSLTPEEQQLLASQQQMFNTGLTSEMSFHQMFQQYLSQQLKMNQRKPVKRPGSPSTRLGSPPEKKPASATSPKSLESKTSPVASIAASSPSTAESAAISPIPKPKATPPAAST